MAKNKSTSRKTPQSISPEDALKFLEDIRTLAEEANAGKGTTVAISLRVPESILRAIKLKAQFDGKKYQSLMIEYLRRGLRGDR